MGIFKKRPLALAAACFIFCVATAFLLPFSAYPWLLIVLAAALIGLLIPFCKRASNRVCFIALLLTIAALLGFGSVFLERQRAEARFLPYIGETVTAEIEIKSVYSDTVYGARLLADVKSVNGERSNAKVLLVLNGASPFYYGDRLQGTFLCTTLEEHSFYEGQESTYRADSAYVALALSDDGAIVLTRDGNGHFGALLADFRARLHHRLVSLLDEEATELISAMILGTRDDLAQSAKRDFRRVGLSHLLAISGLHLTIIVMLLDRLLRLMRLKKPPRILLIFVFCVAYLILTGCSFSMMRAVCMLCVLQVAYFAKGDYDAFTALMTVGAVLLFLSPSALFDLSFQMTMLATFGILAFGEIQVAVSRIFPRKKKGLVGALVRCGRALLSSVLVSLFATIAILPVQWLIFGEISLLTPLSNLFAIPLSYPLLVFGMASIAFSFAPWLAALLLRPAVWSARALLHLTAWLSPLEGMLSLRYGFVPYIFIPFLLLTLLLLVIDLKKRKVLTLMPTALAVVAFAVCMFVTMLGGNASASVIYRTTGRNDGLLMQQQRTSVICDISGGSMTQLYNDYKLLQAFGATDVDLLILTHYHPQQATALTKFSGAVLVRRLKLPYPQSERDREAHDAILQSAAAAGIPIEYYALGEAVSVGRGGTLCLETALYQERSVEPAMRLSLSFAERTVCYQSAALGEYADALSFALSPVDAQYLILGGHGPVPHETIRLELSQTVEEVVISDERALDQYIFASGVTHTLLPKQVVYTLK